MDDGPIKADADISKASTGGGRTRASELEREVELEVTELELLADWSMAGHTRSRTLTC